MATHNQTKGEFIDSVMRGVNSVDAGVKGALNYVKLAARAQGNPAALARATKMAKSYGKPSAYATLAIEAGNTAWLASDPEKRARAETEYAANSEKPLVERVIESVWNPTDTLYAAGKEIYDTTKTYESVERGQMESENNSLLRKIAKHDKQTAKAAQDSLGINPEFERAAGGRTHPKDKRYPEVKPDPDTMEFFKKNPAVAGMATGAGLNGYDGPRQVMVNPHSGLNPQQKDGLLRNERLRHLMDESKPELGFDPTPAQVASFQGTEYGKPENRGKLKETLVARILTGDESAGKITRPQSEAARKIGRLYNNSVTPTNPLSTAYQMDAPLPGLPGAVTRRERKPFTR
jgi:hypothetical protein